MKIDMIIGTCPLYMASLEGGKLGDFRETSESEKQEGTRYFFPKDGDSFIPDRSKPCDREGNLLGDLS